MVRILTNALSFHTHSLRTAFLLPGMIGCLYVHEDRTVWVALLAYTICELGETP